MTQATHLPQHLDFDIGGFGGSWHKVQWQGGTLIYQTGDFGSAEGETTQVVPSEEQWQGFWAEVEKAGAWSWRPDYTRPVLDGTSWSLELRHGDKRIKSGGSNGYPGSDDEGYEPGSAFDIFLQALIRLTGRNMN